MSDPDLSGAAYGVANPADAPDFSQRPNSSRSTTHTHTDPATEVTHIQNSQPQASTMERSASEDMRTECEDLKEAAEQTLNVIVDLGLDGNIRWASPSWEEVIGSSVDEVLNQSISEALRLDPSVFPAAIERMQSDDSRSQIIHFSIALGQLSKIAKRRIESFEHQLNAFPENQRPQDFPDGPDLGLLLEAQGIMVVERGSEEDNHSMWMLRPAKIRKVTLDLPDVVAESLGIGAEILAHYLNKIAEAGGTTSGNEIKPPPPVLCRICERQIPPWWFEKHTDLCYQEHKAEMDVQVAHDNLNEHRNAIVKVLDALDSQNRPTRSLFGPTIDQSNLPTPQAEYKGYRIGPSSTPASNPSSGRASPSISQSRERPSTSFGHQRGRSFAVRRPVVRIVELVVDLCDTALEINTPALKEGSGTMGGEPRTQSPQSENRATQVLQWQSPNSGVGADYDPGLVMLCEDTDNLARTKVDAVLRFRRILEYSERIRVEFSLIVQDCVENAIRKATQIAAGESSSSSDCESDPNIEIDNDLGLEEPSSPNLASIIPPSPGVPNEKSVSTPVRLLRQSSLAMAMAMKTGSDPNFLEGLRPSSTRSSSPRPQNMSALPSKRTSVLFDPDNGTESDTSVHSTALSQAWRADSPGPELPTSSRLAAPRERKRRSYILTSVMSSRQQSPSRLSSGQPNSPYRLTKSQNPDVQSPLTSPVLGSGSMDISSPAPSAQSHSIQNTHHNIHHRRQSSAASSEITRPSVSPRLLPVMSNLQPRASPPSIKDFEIIKPISKGAFGSVYLVKKKATGDYFAIKVLKKADMVAKNQVTNVKAERAIMMWQGESDFVAKLYWTFASKDYLYLVMEYLNGGDLASLIKVIGGLPEDWAKKYLAEIVLGVEHLHSRGIVHRDLKPDNLLVDQHGHLKLTDFGLSRMGMIGRQKRALHSKAEEPMPDLLKGGPFHRAASIVQLRTSSFDLHNKSPAQTPNLIPGSSQDSNLTSYFPVPPRLDNPSSTLLRRTSSIHRSDSEPGESVPFPLRNIWPPLDDALLPPPLQLNSLSRLTGTFLESEPLSIETALTDASAPTSHPPSITRQNTMDSTTTGHNTQCSTPSSTTLPPLPMPLFDPEDNSDRRFVGTPDYLAPETVNGDAQDELSDWWSIGCILFELLYGYPPFHADTPENVFQNILARNIHWPDEEECPASDEAKDLMNRLLCIEQSTRLGANTDERYSSGGAEIKAHPWLEEVNWDTVRQDEASFIPALDHPENTEYFDARGASIQNFAPEFEDQPKSGSDIAPSEFSRPYDALSRPRTIGPPPKRGLMPLHIPPHVRESRNRRLSETAGGDDFGSFSYKNLPVLEKANKDVIQKLRAEAMQAVAQPPSVTGSPSHTAPVPSLEASPTIPNPVQRTLSSNRMMGRPSSPMLSHVNSSPSRTSQPTSPMLISSFNSTHNALRKASSSSSSNSQASTLGIHSSVTQDNIRNSPSGHKTTFSNSSSPIRIVTKSQALPLNAALERSTPLARITGTILDGPNLKINPSSNPSQDGSSKDSRNFVSVAKRHPSGVEVSPSSSDSEESRQKALLRVQRRRQSSRRLSHISGLEGPIFRPLDVLVCDDHPVSRWVLEKLLEKLRCRTISVTNGSDAVRYAMSEVKFDIILLEYKLPQVNGTEVARMIKTTKNSNSHTPLVAVTGYVQDLQSLCHFDSLVEKPPTLQKMIDVLNRHCNWKPAPPGWTQQSSYASLQAQFPAPLAGPLSSLALSRHDSIRSGDSPGSSFGGSQAPGYPNFCGSSRGESTECSLFDPEDTSQFSKHQSSDSRDRDLLKAFKGLGIHEETESVSSDHGTDSGRDSFAWRSVASSTDLSAVTTPQSKPSPGSEYHARKLSDLHSSRRRFLDRSNSTGMAMDESSVASDEDEESINPPTMSFRAHPRSVNRLRGSSKLGVEMMRTNSRGSIVSVGEPESLLGPITSPVRRDSADSMGSTSNLSLSADPPDSDMADTVITRPWPPKFTIPPSDRSPLMDRLWGSQSSPTSNKPSFPMWSFFPPSVGPGSSTSTSVPPTITTTDPTPLAPIQDDSGPESDSAATPRPVVLTPVKDGSGQAIALNLDSDKTPRPGSRTL